MAMIGSCGLARYTFGFTGGGVGQQTVSVAGNTADIETVQLLIKQRYVCINTLCNYKYVPMSECFQ